MATARPTAECRALLDWLRATLPGDCAAGALPVTERGAAPFAIEERAIRGAVRQRRNEFRAGRAAARAALARLGLGPCALPARAQRDPIWPQGFLGSISHAADHAVAVVARRGHVGAIGVDLEANTGLAPALVARICLPEERPDRAASMAADADPAVLCFIAKEAILKSLLPRRRTAIDWLRLRVRLQPRQRHFEASLCPGHGAAFVPLPGEGWFHCTPRLVAAAFVAFSAV